jgi:hypothetical protein
MNETRIKCLNLRAIRKEGKVHGSFPYNEPGINNENVGEYQPHDTR